MKKNSFFGLFVLLIVLSSCWFDDEDYDKRDHSSDKNQDAYPVKVAKSISGEYHRTLRVNGSFLPFKEANLGTSMPGRVEKFHYKPGDFVMQGSLLVELSAEMLTQAVIEYNAIKNDYNRISRLLERGSISQMEYDHIKAKLDATRVQKEMLRKNTSVTAPFDGIITEQLVQEGENYFFNISLEPGYSHSSGILRLMQLNPIKAVVDLNENYLKYINEGQAVKVICSALDEEFAGVISFIRPALSTVTRSAKVEITISNPGHKIFPGMFATVVFTLEEEEGVKVPLSAVSRQPGSAQNYVFKVKNDTAYQIPITRLATQDNMVFVDGVDADILVVTEGKNRLSDGSFVNIIKKED